MPIPSPNLDDRDFLQLVNEAVERIRASASEWTDLSPGDPGITLLEAFAHLTEVMIYRLNRVPDKAYRAYLNLIGLRLWPPVAAKATLRFTRVDERSELDIQIPRGTRVGVVPGGADRPPVFVITETVTLEAGQAHIDVPAYHCELVEAELVGIAAGVPGQTLRVARPPITETPDVDDLIVGVETNARELVERVPAIEFGERPYQIWSEAPNFADLAPDEAVFVVDRSAGTISFAPALDLGPTSRDQGAGMAQALALTPEAGREIRVWYRTGGGIAGNVAAGTLTVLVDPLPGLKVTNPTRATGGRAMESIDNALVRGPQEFHARDRAVTARDYELIARRSGGISRARALARADYWVFAPRGSVEVVIVPQVDPDALTSGRVHIDDLESHATEEALIQVAEALDTRRPLGISCTVKWAKFKSVSVRARVGIRPEEDEQALRSRVLERLHDTINPLPSGRRARASQARSSPGWPFGQALRASDVYDILLAEPGVLWADRVQLAVDQVPGSDVTSVAVDQYQASAWYAASGPNLFRSLNGCIGWELMRRFEGETIKVIEPYVREPGRVGLGERPGYVAVVTHVAGGEGSRVHASMDMGETWGDRPVAQFAFAVEDLAWIQRDEVPGLLLATVKGLYEQDLKSGANSVLLSVDPAYVDLGFYQVVAYTEPRGSVAVALAAHQTRGVYRSRLEGRAGTFLRSGLIDEDIRTLAVQYEGSTTYLWAGAAAEGGGSGSGCFRARLEEESLSWEPLQEGWEGGSCWDIAFLDDYAFGASHLAGVQRLELRGGQPRWWRPAVDSGLPMQEVGRFHTVRTVAADSSSLMVVAGGPAGVYRSLGRSGVRPGEHFELASRSGFDDAVTLPANWLFVSGDHDIEVEKPR